jgi:hypothetical protein
LAATELLLSDPLLFPSRHIHILTDNMSCVSWLLRHRAVHPLHLFLLYVFSLVQVRHRVVITVGHVKGSDNQYADAASRTFDCPDGDRLRKDILPLPRSQFPPTFAASLARWSTTASPSILQLLHDASTVSGLGRSSGSVQHTNWNQIFPPSSHATSTPYFSPLPSDFDL